MKLRRAPDLIPDPAPAASCPASGRRRRALRLALPLVSFVVPTLIVGYGFVIPRSCIAGVNDLTIGFATTILGACLSYVAGVRAARAS
jgi:hypothetical protein